MDPNWIMAIIAIAAIISPAIVSFIDNHFKYKSRQLELNYSKKQEALSNFVNTSLGSYNTNNFKDVINYNVAKNNLYIFFNYVPDRYLSNLETYNDKHELDKFKNTINLIIKELSKQIDK